jgi:hypothetical protein
MGPRLGMLRFLKGNLGELDRTYEGCTPATRETVEAPHEQAPRARASELVSRRRLDP